MEENKTIKFPEGFLWGTATSAYQVEGGIKNDWSEWERSPERLKFLMKKGKFAADFICDRAADSYSRWQEDLELAEKMNNNAVRFGLEWARIQPEKETWDVEAIDHYRQMLRSAKKRKMKTFVTLWHYTTPLWLSGSGYWESAETAKAFNEYVNVAVKELGADVDFWMTVNEPNMYAYGGYINRQFPPQKKSMFLARKVLKNYALAHNLAYDTIHKHFPSAKVGFALLLNFFEPAHKWNPIESVYSKILHKIWNERFFKLTRRRMDFIGCNYYFHDRIIWYPPFKKNEDKWVQDKGWEIYPEGLYHVLRYLDKFKKPIYITESGLADAKDKHRKEHIRQHLLWAHKAIADGVDLRGYMHWSLLDNFEWADGFGPKFGLYEVDRITFERKARPSAEYYGEICRNNGLEIYK